MIHVVVHNSCLGLIRQAPLNFDMGYCVRLSFENLNAPDLNGYGADYVAVVVEVIIERPINSTMDIGIIQCQGV